MNTIDDITGLYLEVVFSKGDCPDYRQLLLLMLLFEITRITKPMRSNAPYKSLLVSFAQKQSRP